MKTETTPFKKTLGHVIFCAFDQYITQRKDFKDQHPNAKIIKEMDTISLGMMEVPDPMLIGKTKPQQTIIVVCGIIYEE